MRNSDHNLTRLFAPKEPGAVEVFRVPKVACTLTVTLDELAPCDLNPRQSVNPLYGDIKASILAKGLDHPPNITVRPGGTQYMIRDGGNTRLQILNELWTETQEPRFYQFECSFRPWISDLDMLASHMVENESRGEMLFIDRALAAVQMRDFLREEGVLKKDSVRGLAEAITQTGWTLQHQDLSYMLYAVEELFPYLPTVFWSGLGRDSVRKIRKLHSAAQDYWQQELADQPALSDEQFTGLWRAALGEADSDTFVIEDLHDQLYPRLETQLGVTGMGMVKAHIEAILFDKKIGLQTGATMPVILPPDTPAVAPTGTPVPAMAGAGRTSTDQWTAPASSPVLHGGPQERPPHTVSGSVPETVSGSVPESEASPPSTEDDLIHRVHGHMKALVMHFELTRWIRLCESGAGFTVDRDFKPLAAVREDRELFQRAVLQSLIECEAATQLTPEQLYQLPDQLCDQLYAGRWKDMSLAQSILLQARLNPGMVGAEAAETAFAALRGLEPLIYHITRQRNKRNTGNA